MRKIAIRIDDVCPQMNIECFERFTAILDKYGVKPLIGVVPLCTDNSLNVQDAIDDFGAYIGSLTEKGYTVAMHGFNHQYKTKHGGMFPLNHYSEFAGITYKEQVHMLMEGRKKLRELKLDTNIFMAPAHSYDKNTLRALKKAGFYYITDGYGKYPYIYNGLVFLPISLLMKKELKGKDGFTTFVYHTATMKDKDFEAFEEFIRTNSKRIIDYKELINVQPVFRGSFGAFVERTLARLKHFAGKLRK